MTPVRLRAVFAAGLLLAGCASPPEPAPAGAADGPVINIRPPARMLSEAQFDEVMRGALSLSDAYQEERNYTAVMNRADVTADQRTRALYMRAVVRGGATASNLNCALADHDAQMKIIRPGHPLYERAVNGKASGRGDERALKLIAG